MSQAPPPDLDLSRVRCDFCPEEWDVNTEDFAELRAAAPKIFGHIHEHHQIEWDAKPEYNEFARHCGVYLG